MNAASSSSSLRRGRRRSCYSGTKTRPQSSLPLTIKWPTELQYFCGAGLLVPTPGTHNSIFSHSWRKGRLSVACHVEGPPDQRADAHQLNRLRTAERTTGLIVYERLVQLNLQERLRAPDLRVTAFTTPSARSLWRRLLPTGPSRGYNRTVWRPMRDIFVVPEPQGQGKVATLVAT